MSTVGGVLVVLGVGLLAGAGILLIVGGRSLGGLKWNPGGDAFIDYMRQLVSGADDPTKRGAVRQLRLGWALGLLSMLVLVPGLMLLIPA